MFDLSEIPTDPSDALKAIITKLLTISGGNATIGDLRNKGHALYSDLVIGTTAAMKAAERMGNQNVTETIVTNLTLKDEDSLTKLKEKFQTSLQLAVAHEFDNHFIDETAVLEFDQAAVPRNEREEIRLSLQKARDLAARAEFLADPVRRSFLHKISLAENELFKEKVGFQAFLAAAYEGSRLLRSYGEAAQPLADAVETARTKTEKHVSGYHQIGVDKKPKQLPRPPEKSGAN